MLLLTIYAKNAGASYSGVKKFGRGIVDHDHGSLSFWRGERMPLSITDNGQPSAAMMRFIPNSELIEREKAEADAAKPTETQETVTLGKVIDDIFEANRSYRETAGIDEDMLASLRQRENEYDPAKLTAIQARGGSDVFMGLTNVKCRGAEAWITDVLASAGEKPWGLDPSPVPDLPPAVEAAIVAKVMQEWEQRLMAGGMTEEEAFSQAAAMRDSIEDARKAEAEVRAMRMERKCEDELAVGGWLKAFDECITHIVTLKSGFMKGPILRTRATLTYEKDASGKTAPVVGQEIVKEYEAPSPFDIYPSEGSTNPNDGDLIERVRFTRKSLAAIRDLPGSGWRRDAINMVLKDYGQSGFSVDVSTDQERQELERKIGLNQAPKGVIEGLELWGSIQGQVLLDDGMTKDGDGKPIQPLDEYEINAIKIDRHVVYVAFNPNPLGKRPYYHTGYEKIPGSFWYKGVPELMADLQKIINAAIRSMVNNMGVSSGPQVVINDTGRIHPGENVTSITPLKVWQFTNKSNMTPDPIKFVDIPSNAGELMGIYEKIASLADDYTGIPAYSYGNDRVAGAGRTLGGLEMLMNSAARGIKRVIYRIHTDIVSPSIGGLVEWNMLYDPDESIKGDVEVKPVGIAALIVKEQLAVRRNKFLDSTNNPVDLSIIGIPGRAALLREEEKSLEMGAGTVVPSKEAIEQKVRAEAMLAAQAGQAGASPQAVPEAA